MQSQYVPVVDKNQTPLMPTTPSRARRWIKSGKATGFWKRGIYCIRLNTDSGTETQQICVGIDPGSKREGVTVKSEAHTFLNLQLSTVDWVKAAVESRRNARRTRRSRKTPYRKCRSNRNINKPRLPPSTKARWQWKLRILNWLQKLYPVTAVVVEDIQAKSFKGKGRKWNRLFSPLQTGKQWFYSQIEQSGVRLSTVQGHETFELRNQLGLKKTKDKLAETFNAHCVDSWTLANWFTGGHSAPDNTDLLLIKPLRFHRRQIHVFNFAKGGVRKNYGSTLSEGLKRGSIVKHFKRGICFVGGTSKGLISLHSLTTGNRLTKSARSVDCQHLTFNSWLIRKPDSMRSYPTAF